MLFEGIEEPFSEVSMTDSQMNNFIDKLEMYKEGMVVTEEQEETVVMENSLQSSIYNTLMLEY